VACFVLDFYLTVIEHPLIALQRCISLRCYTSRMGSATPAEEIPELSSEQAELGNVLPSYMTVSCQKSNVISSWLMLARPVFLLF